MIVELGMNHSQACLMVEETSRSFFLPELVVAQVDSYVGHFIRRKIGILFVLYLDLRKIFRCPNVASVFENPPI